MGETTIADLLAQFVASGPLAAALGFATWKLWQDTKAKDEKIESLYRENLETLRGLRDALNGGGNAAE